ncbi:MAG TPA: rhomboid family intramembrane serine protease [Candidatus Binatia bacterium]|nr:rhomboid family intramembrane serine protease [Candidatus Binatia bacterium]
MIIPLGDAPNPRGVPFVTYALIAANVAVYVLISLPLSFTAPDLSDPILSEYLRVISANLRRPVPMEEILAQVSAYDLFVFHYGFRPAAPDAVSLVTSLFLHGGFLHLAGNMLFLWIYGDNVEYRLGRIRYLLAYLGTGVAATVFHTAFAPTSSMPLVGASGAISGVLGFYFLWFPRNTVRLLFMFFPFFMDVITVPARFVLGLFLIADNLLPFLLTRGMDGGGVAYGAHIGGFIAGLAIAWWMDRREVRGRPREFRRAEVEATGTPAELIRGAIVAGRFAEAAAAYFHLAPEATRGLLAPTESLALAEWLRQQGHSDAALAVYRRALRDRPSGPDAAAAHLGAGLVQLEDLDQPAPAYQHFLDALDCDPSPEVAGHARAALDAITARQKLQVGRARSRPW